MVTAIRIIHVIFCVGLIVTVLLQSGKSAGLSGAIAGGAETFFGKKKGLDSLLSKLTSMFAIMFIVTSVVLALLIK
ncbi:MAG: preprotein translocase subunit SecG [Firmicutes bacterium]|nr:preprotein translocase subunit SecG [Bacillota bacterium]